MTFLSTTLNTSLPAYCGGPVGATGYAGRLASQLGAAATEAPRLVIRGVKQPKTRDNRGVAEWRR